MTVISMLAAIKERMGCVSDTVLAESVGISERTLYYALRGQSSKRTARLVEREAARLGLVEDDGLVTIDDLALLTEQLGIHVLKLSSRVIVLEAALRSGGAPQSTAPVEAGRQSDREPLPAARVPGQAPSASCIDPESTRPCLDHDRHDGVVKPARARRPAARQLKEARS